MSVVYSAIYSGVPVYETMCRNVAIMRRMSDSYMNATQILKVAGLSKPKRTKVLEREVLQGIHEKIQGGYGKYQGTWIPLDAGREIAARYEVADILAPLFDFDPSRDPLGTRPAVTKSTSAYSARVARAQAAAAAADHSSPPPSSPESDANSDTNDASLLTPRRRSIASSPLHLQRTQFPTYPDKPTTDASLYKPRTSDADRPDIRSPGSSSRGGSDDGHYHGSATKLARGSNQIEADDNRNHDGADAVAEKTQWREDQNLDTGDAKQAMADLEASIDSQMFHPSDQAPKMPGRRRRRTGRVGRPRNDQALATQPESTDALMGGVLASRAARTRTRTSSTHYSIGKTASSEDVSGRSSRVSTPVNAVSSLTADANSTAVAAADVSASLTASQSQLPSSHDVWDSNELMPPPPPRRGRLPRTQPHLLGSVSSSTSQKTADLRQHRSAEQQSQQLQQEAYGLLPGVRMRRRARRKTADAVLDANGVEDDRAIANVSSSRRRASLYLQSRHSRRSSNQADMAMSQTQNWDALSAISNTNNEEQLDDIESMDQDAETNLSELSEVQSLSNASDLTNPDDIMTMGPPQAQDFWRRVLNGDLMQMARTASGVCETSGRSLGSSRRHGSTARAVTATERKREILVSIFAHGDDYLTDILEHLRNPDDPDQLDFDMVIDDCESTALHWAAGCARLGIVEALLSRGASLFSRAANNETPLMRAIASPANFEYQAFPVLLQLLGPSLLATDDVGRTALHHAVCLSRSRSKRALVRYYTQCILAYMKRVQGTMPGLTPYALHQLVNIQDAQGRTALHVAACFKCHRVAEVLLRAGADPELRDMYGVTPLEAARGDLRMRRVFTGASDRLIAEMPELDDHSDAPTTPTSQLSPELNFAVQAEPAEVPNASSDAQRPPLPPNSLLNVSRRSSTQTVAPSGPLASLLSFNPATRRSVSDDTIELMRARRDVKTAAARLMPARLDIVDILGARENFTSAIHEAKSIEARIDEMSAMAWRSSMDAVIRHHPFHDTDLWNALPVTTSILNPVGADAAVDVSGEATEPVLYTQSFQVHTTESPPVPLSSTESFPVALSAGDDKDLDKETTVSGEKRPYSNALGLYEVSAKHPRLDDRGLLDLLGDATDIVTRATTTTPATTAVTSDALSFSRVSGMMLPALPPLDKIDNDTSSMRMMDVDDTSGGDAETRNSVLGSNLVDASGGDFSVAPLPQLIETPRYALASNVAAAVSQVEAAAAAAAAVSSSRSYGIATPTTPPTSITPPHHQQSIESQLQMHLINLRSRMHQYELACRDMVAEIHAIDSTRRTKDQRYRSAIAKCLDIPLNMLDAALETHVSGSV